MTGWHSLHSDTIFALVICNPHWTHCSFNTKTHQEGKNTKSQPGLKKLNLRDQRMMRMRLPNLTWQAKSGMLFWLHWSNQQKLACSISHKKGRGWLKPARSIDNLDIGKIDIEATLTPPTLQSRATFVVFFSCISLSLSLFLQIVQVEIKSLKRVFTRPRLVSLSKLLEKTPEIAQRQKGSFVQPQMLVYAVAEEANCQRQQAQNR